MKLSNIFRPIVGTMLILLVPLIAMLFVDEMKWNLFDFLVLGILVFSTGLIYELVATRVNSKYKVAVGILLVTAMLLVFAELAVGLFGSPIAGN